MFHFAPYQAYYVNESYIPSFFNYTTVLGDGLPPFIYCLQQPAEYMQHHF
jgi:hypothetical protein